MSSDQNSLLSTRSKLVIDGAFAVLILIVFSVIFIAYSQISSNLSQIDQVINHQHRKIDLATAIYSTAEERQEQLIQIQHASDPFERDEALQRFSELASDHLLAREQLARLINGQTEKTMFGKIIELAGLSSLAHRELITLLSNNQSAESHEALVKKSFPAHSALLKQIRAFLEYEQLMSEREIEQARKRFDNVLSLLALMLIFAVFICIFIVISVTRRMKQADNMLFAQTTLESIGDAVITTNATGRIIYTNGKASSLLNIKVRELMGKQLSDAFQNGHQSLTPDITNSWNTIHDTCLFGEIRLKSSDYSEKEVEYRMSPIRDKDNKIQGSVLAFQDITARKLIENELYRSQERLSLVLKGSNDGIWDYSLETGEIYFSPRWKEMLGFNEQEFEDSFTAWQKQIHPHDLGNILLAWTDCMNQVADSFQIEYRMQSKNDAWIWIECRGLALLDGNNRPVRLTGSHTDITARKNVEQALFEAKEHAEVTLQSIGDAVITLDKDGKIDFLNTAAEQLCGWPSEQAKGRPFNKVIKLYEEDDGEPVDILNTLDQSQKSRSKNFTHAVLVSRDSKEHCVEHTFSSIKDRSCKTAGVVIVLRDVSTERALKQQLYWQASHDSLTGLVNRSTFESRLGEAIESARAYHEQYALLYMDLDQFKVVNDTCGHLAGDELLRQLATLLKNNLRAADTLARLGGDEFGILLDRCPLNDAVSIAQSLKESVSNFRFGWENKTFEIGASIGIVPVTSTSASKDHLLSAADVACYAAKDQGRNRVHLYEGSDNDLSKSHGEMHWVTRISEALQENRFVLYQQAILGIGEGINEIHHEILVRMLDADGKIIPPGAFVPAAERYNLMPAIDRWVIRNLFAFCSASPVQTDNSTSAKRKIYTVNLSGNSINDADFLAFVREQILLHNLPAECFCFEITETSAIANLSTATEFIHELKKLGCLFALDDFGSGLSSFGYLKNLPVDFLKIDGQFVRGIVDDPIDAEMVRSINEIGHVIGIQTIAEFVENSAILDRLKEIGVDFAQGYEIARPEPVMESVQRKTAS